MAANGQLVFTDVDKVTFKGVGNASNAVIDTTTGKIGVGVDSPDANLHVLGNCFVSTNFELGGTMTMGTVTVRAQHELSAITATGNTTPHTIEFTNAETGIVTTGNVGIGTTSPDATLHVSGNAYVSSNLEVGTANLFVDTVNSRVGIGTTNPGNPLVIYGPDQVNTFSAQCVISSNSTTGLINSGGTLLFQGHDGVNARGWATVSGLKENGTSGNYASYLRFDTRSSGASVLTERMRITSAGNVGIGTTDPLSELDIYNPAGTELIVSRNAGSSVNPTIRLWNFDDNNYNNHSVGTSIGTINFSGNERLTGDTHTDNSRAFSYANTLYDWARISALFAGSSSSATTTNGHVRGDLAFYTNNGDTATSNLQERMRIKHDGNVGIGTTSPSATLELFKGFASTGLYDTATLKFSTTNTTNNWDVGSIRGAVKLNAGGTSGYPGGLVFATKSPSGGADGGLTDKMVIDANGNVGIGTATPRTNLHIGQQLNSQGDKNTIPAAGLGISADFPSSTHAWFAHRVNATGDEYWGLAVGTIYDGASYLQNLNKNSGTYYDLLLQPNGGNVGIGTTDPGAKFQVNGLGFANVANSSRSYFLYSSTGLIQNTGTWGNASIYATDSIVTGSYIASIQGTVGASDERIKKEVSDINDGSALETLRLLKPKQYKYKDEISRGTDPVWGFIAQEVRETLPYATQIRSEYLPNIYELATVSSSNVITFTNFNTSNLMSNANTISLRTVKGTSERVNIVEVVDEQTIRVDKDLSESIGSVDESGNVMTGNEIFVYGQEVDDFVYLKKDAIWTIATAALQEVDRQLQTEKARNDSLEARILALENA